MQLTVAHIGSRSTKTGVRAQYDGLARLYLDRIEPYFPIQTEVFATEAALLDWLARPGKPGKPGRVAAIPVLCDSRGKQLSSSEFAQWLGARRDQGSQHIVFAIGPADGWSAAALEAARPGLVFSFGAMTMAHELARLVLAEQIYRASTILAGHPYHSGH